MRSRALALIVCVVFCAMCLALQFASVNNPRMRQPRLLAGSIPGSTLSGREPLRPRSGTTLQTAAIIVAEFDSATSLCTLGSVICGRFTVSSQFDDRAGFGRAPPRPL